MKGLSRIFLVAGLGVVLACDGSSTEAQSGVEDRIHEEVAEAKRDAESDEGVVAGAPKVSERYQSSINRGWENAVAGETPAYACAGLKGRVMGTGETADAEALEALYACNVLLPVRYFETFLGKVEAGEKTCYDFQREMMMQLPGMTLSVGTIQGMVDAMGDDPETAAADTLTAAVGGEALEEGLMEPERAIKDRLKESTRRACPDSADAILY